jgi:hypothetical protein
VDTARGSPDDILAIEGATAVNGQVCDASERSVVVLVAGAIGDL